MPLSEDAFASLIDAGCTACGSKKLVVEAIVTQRMTLLSGEVYGKPSWTYKGEDLVRGTHRIACTTCKATLFATDACPKCGSEGGVARALSMRNALDLPASCSHCGNEQMLANAFVPAEVQHDGKRASKPRTFATPDDEGFRAFRVQCIECKSLDERTAPCPLCADP